MSAVYYTSDLHLSHRLVSGLREFETTEDHDEAICENWIANVKAEDRVLVLGDLTVGGPGKVLRALDIISKLPGEKILIFGNHDPVHPMHINPWKYIDAFRDVFSYMAPYMRRKLDGHVVELCHFPFAEDHTEVPRYVEHRRPDYGQFLIHGHTHSSEQVNGREINVCLEAHDLAPVNQEWVIQQIKIQTEGNDVNCLMV